MQLMECVEIGTINKKNFDFNFDILCLLGQFGHPALSSGYRITKSTEFVADVGMLKKSPFAEII